MSDAINWSEELIRVAITLFASGIGAWLSIRFLPLKAKHAEWVWKKKIEAQEFVFDALSEVAFLSQNYLNSEYADGFSMAGVPASDTEKAIFERVKKLHQKAAGLSLLLNTKQNEILDDFLEISQRTLDEARKSWGQWDEGDHFAEEQHINETINAIGSVAITSLDKMRKHIKPIYR